MVIAIVMSLAGVIALFSLPISLYPQITPPEVNVSANYTGASAEVVANTIMGRFGIRIRYATYVF